MAKYQIVGLTTDNKRVEICYTRSAFEARTIQAENEPKFARVLVIGKDGEIGREALMQLADAGSADVA